jgi:pimeloyl-ACP methyl ester carboxylesterase
VNEVSLYPFHQTGDVSDLNVPALRIVGDMQELEVSAAITYRTLNPSIHLSIIPMAGHLVHKDQPALYAQAVHTFIKGVK